MACVSLPDADLSLVATGSEFLAVRAPHNIVQDALLTHKRLHKHTVSEYCVKQTLNLCVLVKRRGFIVPF
jgi:hypothetical protein